MASIFDSLMGRIPIPAQRPMALGGQFPQQPQPQSGLNAFQRFAGNNSDALLQAGLGLLSGQTAPQQVGLAAQGFGAARQNNKTMRFIKENFPELEPYIQAGVPAQDLMKMVASKKLEAQMSGKGTDDIQEYNFATSQGYKGTFQDYMTDMRKAGATNVTVGGGKYGTIPPGYMLNEGEGGVSMAPIPGGPAAQDIAGAESQAIVKKGQADVATRVVTSAAARARTAAGKRDFGPYGQSIVENAPWTDSAEVSRQVQVLKSQATIENLNAMRAASPTGGALGNVTEGEGRMLAAKSGALDPSSPTFQRDLDDYELTLLQVVHGPQEGQRIFEQTRAPSLPSGAGGTTSGGVQWSIEP